MTLKDYTNLPDARKAIIVKDIIYKKNQNVNLILARQYCYGLKKYAGKKLRIRKIYAEYCRTHREKLISSHKFLRYESVKQKIIDEKMKEMYEQL